MLKQLHDCTEIKTKITQERLVFKLLENDLEKTKRIRQILEQYLEPISDFDLTSFKSEEEVKILQEDFNLDLLTLASSILAYVATSDLAAKLAQTSLKSTVLIDHRQLVLQLLSI